MSDPYEFIVVPPIAEWDRIIAETENDHDVAFGIPVDGPMLDALEQLRRDVMQEFMRKVWYG